MSANGSMKAFCSSSAREKADWPNHSTRMLLLQFRDLTAGLALGSGLLGVVIATPAQRRGRGGDQAGDDREAERRVQPVPERGRDQPRKEGRPGQHGVGMRRQRSQRLGPDQVLDRVVAEEGGEED